MPRQKGRGMGKGKKRAKGHVIEGQSSDDISGMADQGPEVRRETETKKSAKKKKLLSVNVSSPEESVERFEQEKVVGAVGRPNLKKRKAVDYSEDVEYTDGGEEVLKTGQDDSQSTKSNVSKSPSSDEDEPEDSDSNNSDEDELHDNNGKPTKMKRKILIKRANTERNVPCPSCDVKLPTFGYLCRHLRSRHPDLKNKNKDEWNRMEACAKRRKEVGDGLFPCTVCDKKFINFRYLGIHIRECHPNQLVLDEFGYKVVPQCSGKVPKNEFQWQCPFCKTSTTTACSLQSHLNYCHLSEGSMEVNGRVFTPRRHLPNGFYHKSEYVCEICKWVVKSWTGLKIHVGKLHPEIEVFQHEGNDVIPTKRTTRERNGENEFQWQCPFCETSTIKAWSLQTHLNHSHLTEGSIEVNGRVFTPRKPLPYGFDKKSEYVCEICERVLKTFTVLRTHVGKVHPEMEVFQHQGYDIIPIKRTIRARNRNNKFQWQCPFCETSTIKVWSLQTHLNHCHLTEGPIEVNGRVFTPRKPLPNGFYHKSEYVCEICKWVVKTIGGLKIHVGKLHPEIEIFQHEGIDVIPTKRQIGENEFQWQCPFCKTSTTTAWFLQTHLNRRHLTEGSMEVNGRVFTPRRPLKATNKDTKTKKKLMTTEDDIEPMETSSSNDTEKLKENYATQKEVVPLLSYKKIRDQEKQILKNEKESLRNIVNERKQIKEKQRIEAITSIKHICDVCCFSSECNVAFLSHIRMDHGHEALKVELDKQFPDEEEGSQQIAKKEQLSDNEDNME